MSREIAHAIEAKSLADILERVLDKGIVIAGDIRIKLADIELLTINIRLLIASVDKAREMGIDWWEGNPFLSSLARQREEQRIMEKKDAEIEALKRRIEQIEGTPALRSQSVAELKAAT
ncbi:MAG: gas vesicle protein [Candidatus Latescibacteria bacterium]|nr:gas vesicle protein [Candidatus Latescibacterota bacterium]